MTKKELEKFIHLLAWKTDEDKREKFVEYLCAGDKNAPVHGDDTVVSCIKQETAAVMKDLKRIEQGELCIAGYFNEYYDDWYDDVDDEFVFRNTDKIQSIIMKACDVLKSATEMTLYDEAYHLSNEMINLRISINGDYADNVQEYMYLNEVYETNVFQFDFRGFGLNALYSQYVIKTGEERVREMYRTLLYFCCVNLKIEQILQLGYDDLVGCGQFLNDWISFLGEINSKDSRKFIREAVKLSAGTDDILSAAEKYVKIHPGLYEELLIDGRDLSNEQLLEIGLDALGRIPVELVIRSRIALMTAEYAIKLNKPSVAEYCLIEAFRSDTTVTNYLRIVFNCENYSKLIPVMKEIYNGFSGNLNNVFTDRNDDLCRNILRADMHCSLLLLGMEFERIFKFRKNMKDNNSKGEIASVKCPTPLLLIYFYAGEDMLPGIRAMCMKAVENIDFRPDKYFFLNAEKTEDIKSEELLFMCVRKWKKYAMSEYDYKEEFLKYIGNAIHTDTVNVLKRQERFCYGNCASYIAALGEVNDSIGNTDKGKTALINQYNKEFPRYRAFRKELQSF